jgi:inosine/xanthosine triphosphatase
MIGPRTIDRAAVGSRNAGKLEAVRRALADPAIAGLVAFSSVDGFEVVPGVPENPVGFHETMVGARNRARGAFAAASQSPKPSKVWGIGLESGFISLSPEFTAVYNFDVCCVFDGEHDFFGVSCGVEYPRKLCENIFVNGQDFQTARAFIDASPDLEQKGGVIGVLTAGVIDRIGTAAQAVKPALVRALDPAGKYGG